MPPVRNQIGRDPEQPCCKRNPPPLEPLQVRQSLMEYFGSQIFSLCPVLYPAHDVAVDPLEVEFVKLRKARRIPLRRLDQKPLVRFFLQSLQQVLRGFCLTSD